MVGAEGTRVKQFEAEILSNKRVAESWRELDLAWDPSAGRPAPGQFLTLRVSPRLDPLLRRPFAFAGAAQDASSVSIVYQVRGSATAILAGLAAGTVLDVIGPLGRGFPPPAPVETALLAAGGIGIGPVLFLARALATSSQVASTPAASLEQAREPAHDARGAVLEAPEQAAAGASATRGGATLALGFRSADSIPDLEIPAGAAICTDDGSAGFPGSVADWVSLNAPAGGLRLYACGPAPMLAALARLCSARRWASSFSAEQWMACGVGACMGCALPATGGGFLRACSEGPVFDSPPGGPFAVDWAAGAAGERA